MVMLGDNEQVPLGNMVKLHKVGCFFLMSALSARSSRCVLNSPLPAGCFEGCVTWERRLESATSFRFGKKNCGFLDEQNHMVF